MRWQWYNTNIGRSVLKAWPVRFQTAFNSMCLPLFKLRGNSYFLPGAVCWPHSGWMRKWYAKRYSSGCVNNTTVDGWIPSNQFSVVGWRQRASKSQYRNTPTQHYFHWPVGGAKIIYSTSVFVSTTQSPCAMLFTPTHSHQIHILMVEDAIVNCLCVCIHMLLTASRTPHWVQYLDQPHSSRKARTKLPNLVLRDNKPRHWAMIPCTSFGLLIIQRGVHLGNIWWEQFRSK